VRRRPRRTDQRRWSSLTRSESALLMRRGRLAAKSAASSSRPKPCRAISGPLTPVRRGLSGSLTDIQPRRLSPVEAWTEQLPKLTIPFFAASLGRPRELASARTARNGTRATGPSRGFIGEKSKQTLAARQRVRGTSPLTLRSTMDVSRNLSRALRVPLGWPAATLDRTRPTPARQPVTGTARQTLSGVALSRPSHRLVIQGWTQHLPPDS
jgi:hypothetical protein